MGIQKLVAWLLGKSDVLETQRLERWHRGIKAFEAGERLYFDKRYDEALEYLDESIKLGYEDPDLFFSRGACLQSLDFHLDAIDDFGKAIAIRDDDSNYYFMRSISRGCVGDLHERVSDLVIAISLAGQNNPHSRSHNEGAREHGYLNGISDVYEIQMRHAERDLEQQAADEYRRRPPHGDLRADLVSKRQAAAKRRTL